MIQYGVPFSAAVGCVVYFPITVIAFVTKINFSISVVVCRNRNRIAIIIKYVIPFSEAVGSIVYFPITIVAFVA